MTGVETDFSSTDVETDFSSTVHVPICATPVPFSWSPVSLKWSFVLVSFSVTWKEPTFDGHSRGVL